MKKIAILIPCYNEEQTVGKVIDDHKKAIPEAEIYVYDNNSTDDTVKIAKQHGAIVRHEYRQGKGNVVRSQFRDIEADVYYMIDGDDTYPAEHARQMINEVLEGRADMVIGDRLSSTYFTENKRFGHNFGNKIVRSMINKLFKAKVNDIMTGQRAFSYDFVKTFPVLSKGFELETEMTIHALDKNLKIVELPVEYRDRPEGSVSKLNTVGDGVKVLSTIFNLVREFKPLFFFTIFGLAFIIAALICGISVLYELDMTGVLRIPTMIATMILFVASLLLFIAGLILDLIAKKHRQLFEINLNIIVTQRKNEVQISKK